MSCDYFSAFFSVLFILKINFYCWCRLKEQAGFQAHMKYLQTILYHHYQALVIWGFFYHHHHHHSIC